MLAFFQGRHETPRLGTLRQLALFSTLSRLELRVVDGLLHERRFLKGEIIFDEGEEGQALHVVITGRVVICKQGEPETGRIAEINAGLADSEIKARIADIGATVLPGSPADFGRLIAAETEKWAKVVKFSGAKPD